jgi:hypothetical protein
MAWVSSAMAWILSILIGVLSSLVASGLFLLCLSKLRPNVEIASEISKIVEPGAKPMYCVKVINRARYPLVNVTVRMWVASPRNVVGGQIFHLDSVKMRTPEIMEIRGFDRKDKEARYAMRFIILDDLDKLWADDETTRVRIQIYAIHAPTGFGGSFEQEYHRKRNALVEGDYEYGDSFKIA